MKNDISKNKIEEVMETAFSSIRRLIDVDVVVGKAIYASTLIVFPLTKVTMGFVSGGGEYYSELNEIKKETEYPFSGGSGAGMSLQPIGFLVIDGRDVKIVKMEQKSAFEKLVEAVPEVAKFISKHLNKNEKNEDK
ncbi:MAG: hypothetical protein IJX17_08570 [Clostridia bacterium]|nr:hypothetical protein [Clostridia bacterium]